MKVLFFNNTPAHVHLYKHPVEQLSNIYDVKILARDYGCTVDLIKYLDLPYDIYGEVGTTKYSLLQKISKHYAKILFKTIKYDPDLIFGIGGYAAPIGAISRTPTIGILDSDIPNLNQRLSTTFFDAILTPNAFRRRLGDNHYRFNGFNECAYLHPDVYQSNTEVRDDLNVKNGEPYIIMRFNAFGSHHDIGKSGFTVEERTRLIEKVSEKAKIFVSDEGNDFDLDNTEAYHFNLHPALIHDALSRADLLIADTQTMVTEAALLGTPAIRSNSFVGESDMGNFKELESHDLIHNEHSLDDVIERTNEILTDPTAVERWENRRTEFLKNKVNLTQLIVDIATEFEQSEASLQEIIQKQEELS